MLDMRLPPSGPKLGDIPGQPFTGFKLRTSERVESALAMNVTTGLAPITDLASAPIVAALAGADGARRYSVRCHFGVATVTDAAATLFVELHASYDGTTWFTVAGNSIETEANAENIKAWVDLPMTLGADLPTPMALPAIVGVRVMVAATEDDVYTVPTATGFGNEVLLTLNELA